MHMSRSNWNIKTNCTYHLLPDLIAFFSWLVYILVYAPLGIEMCAGWKQVWVGDNNIVKRLGAVSIWIGRYINITYYYYYKTSRENEFFQWLKPHLHKYIRYGKLVSRLFLFIFPHIIHIKIVFTYFMLDVFQVLSVDIH